MSRKKSEIDRKQINITLNNHNKLKVIAAIEGKKINELADEIISDFFVNNYKDLINSLLNGTEGKRKTSSTKSRSKAKTKEKLKTEEKNEEIEDAPIEDIEYTSNEEVEEAPSVEVEDTSNEEIEDTLSEEVEDTSNEEIEDDPSEEVEIVIDQKEVKNEVKEEVTTTSDNDNKIPTPEITSDEDDYSSEGFFNPTGYYNDENN
ncbi:hypothetical protein ACSW9V_15480 (plasmid) [Clostridium perfringens]|uniref:hypothetical protein n=1 Tax=Clostridium perfringens TaxID=1502 RepID=UPI000B39B2C9|nr:hypothetical protein [Clostridium perfringens]EGT0690187.1 hypothetical protein [Clostridium perfringens]EGT0693821.1 hypothetical protein [Clostridium perfringens]EGT0696708.1 hypothetical protein [Clostridium perfringens]MDU3376288.1 hypothetical protein [Clostridium perfringens]MDU3536250.1 hypothetical protein [Clostridium perfringens]